MTIAGEIFAGLDLRDAGAVIDALGRGAEANVRALCRVGSIDRVVVSTGEAGSGAASQLVASGDLHDNPLHLMRLCRAAGLDGGEPRHLTLHELIHGERLVNGADFSYRVLARVAALKAEFPERVHALVGNHEIAQMTGQLVAKDGVRCNEAFDEGVRLVFGEEAGRVTAAINGFLRSMPLALRFEGTDGGGRVLCAHSLPSPEMMDRFDDGVLDREVTDDDYVSRRGAAHLMAWGRGQTPEQIEGLAQRWGVDVFILGHEKAPEGAVLNGDRAVVLNSDHERGAYVVVDALKPATARELVARRVMLSDGA